MSLATWLHHLLDPHCLACQEAAMENKICTSCETLKLQLSISNSEKKALLDVILSLSKPAENQSSPPVNYENLKPKMMTWNVRRQMLEAEDRKAAQVLMEQRKQSTPNIAPNPGADRSEAIEELEKELGVKDAEA